jgi:hypothetical protein
MATGGAFGRRSSFGRETGSERCKSVSDFRGRIDAGHVMRNSALNILTAAFVIASAAPAVAQGAAPAPAKPEMTESCPGLIATRSPLVQPASLRLAALERDQLRLSYIGHSTFLIESPQLVRIATDYNDYVKSPLLPDIATMNHAHSTHYTLSPDPGIIYVRAAGPTTRSRRASICSTRTCACATSRPTSGHTMAAPSGTAIRFSFSKSPTCASRILAICITH